MYRLLGKGVKTNALLQIYIEINISITGLRVIQEDSIPMYKGIYIVG